MDQFNYFVFSVNNRLQHLPVDARKRVLDKILKDVSKTTIFTPLIDMLEDEELDDEELHAISCDNAIAKEKRIIALQQEYNVQGTIVDTKQVKQEAISKNYCGKTELHLAVEDGDIDKVRQLIESGIDVKACDNNGHTAIHIAFKEENTEIIALLKELNLI